MPAYVVEYERIPEVPGAGRLGRHVRRDSRSAAFPYQRQAGTIQSVEWTRHIPILDQGNLGSCTGNADVGALGTSPLFEDLPAGHPTLDEALAVDVYSRAEILDGGPGLPSEDNGSSGQSVCQVSKNLGLITGYTWCQDLNDCLDALQHGPVLLGVNWYDSFDSPDAEGIVRLPVTAKIRGGHEIVARKVDATRVLVGPDNSWGTGFGLSGSFWFPDDVLDRLFREQGDCAVPLPLTAPVPVPVPVPPVPVPVPPGPDVVHVDAADRALAAALPHGWDTGHHTGANGHAASAVRAWLAAKHL